LNQQNHPAPTQSTRDRIGEPLCRNKALIVAELALVALIFAAYLADFIPFSETPYLLLLGWLSLWLRRVGWRGVGLRRPESWGRTLLIGVVAGVLLQLLSLYVVEPMLARLTGELPDVKQFEMVRGNPAMLLLMLAIVWTLAAFGEEMVHRGYLMNRWVDLFGGGRGAWVAALLITSATFGLVHSYQGLSGMITTAMLGLESGALYLIFKRNLWVPIIAHGVLDTYGFVLMYLGKYPGG
jgi:uncharacterized protein